MTDTVRHLPAYPDQIQRVNTPRTPRVALVDAEPPAAPNAFRVWWDEGGHRAAEAAASGVAEKVVAREVAAAKEYLLAVLQAYREEIRAEVAQEISLARAQALDMGNRIATELHGRIDKHAEEQIQLDALWVNSFNPDDVPEPTAGQVQVTTVTSKPTFTLVEWIFIILSFGIYRPTRNQQ